MLVPGSDTYTSGWWSVPQDLKPSALDPNRHIQEPPGDESDVHPALALAEGVQVLPLGHHVCM